MHPLAPALLGLATFFTATTALAAADVRVQIPAPAAEYVYDTIDYQIVVQNSGNKSAANVSLTVALPATHTSPQVYVMGELSAVDSRCALAGTTLTCALGTIAKGQSKTVTFGVALPEAAEALSISASATTTSNESSLANNSATSTPTLLNYAVAISDGDLAVNRHCTGQGLTSFFECTLFPSSITAHSTLFHGDGALSFPDAPDYDGVWSQDSAESLSFTYLYGGDVIAEFEGYGASPGCFEGIVTFPGSAYLAPYEVCF